MAQRSEFVRRYVEEQGMPFHILVDDTREVTKQYGVWHRVGLDAWNIARPALFLIDAAGAIRRIWVADRQTEFPSSEAIDDAIRGMRG